MWVGSFFLHNYYNFSIVSYVRLPYWPGIDLKLPATRRLSNIDSYCIIDKLNSFLTFRVRCNFQADSKLRSPRTRFFPVPTLRRKRRANHQSIQQYSYNGTYGISLNTVVIKNCVPNNLHTRVNCALSVYERKKMFRNQLTVHRIVLLPYLHCKSTR